MPILKLRFKSKLKEKSYKEKLKLQIKRFEIFFTLDN